jgi:hypothetical protein
MIEQSFITSITQEDVKIENGKTRAKPISVGEQFLLLLFANMAMLGNTHKLDEILSDELELEDEENMNKDVWSPEFLGNVFKLRAFYRFLEKESTQAKLDMDEKKLEDNDFVLNDLTKALHFFKQANNAWGSGLCNLLLYRFNMMASEVAKKGDEKAF